ncbi:murein biosynthesis integral membrane protein MurJ [Pseudoalteromonas rubra]|uniref:murein biosynthesis integral membrane protein MurJ n=1 Tax=Pseudoalteromonas rubra TaxID=43658 RepID=UPI002DB6A982|nr:lipid II flippase MurJ [Pseudoalteromonas rubra]MEC4089938.1 lipid II flippase MurJ [Pseudoalteromonas rubra]
MIRSIGIAFIFTFLGKIVAFLRIQQMANAYPNSYWLDAFFLSFSFTTFFETVVISGAVSTVFIPKYIARKTELRQTDFFKEIYLFLIFVFSIISLGIYLFSGHISSLLVSGDNPVLVKNTQVLLELFCLLPVLSILFQLPTQGNQINERFSVSTLNPIILNSFQLVAIYFLVELAISDELAVYLFATIYLLTMLLCYGCQRYYFNNRYSLLRKWHWKRNISVLLALLPLIAFLSIEEINILVDQYFASGFAEGGVSNLMYANRLVKIFGAIFVAAILTVFYPRVSRLVSDNDLTKANFITNKLMLLIVMFSLPISVLFYFEGNGVAAIIYGSDLAQDVGGILSGYAFMVVFSSIYLLLLKVMFSLGKSNIITSFGVCFLVLNYALNSVFIEFFGLQGVALSSTVISFMQCILLVIVLSRQGFKLVSIGDAKVMSLHIVISFCSLWLVSLIEINFIVSCIVFFIVYYLLSFATNRRFYLSLIELK